jgi:hypothetical protein
VRRNVPPSAEIQQQIDALLVAGVPATDAEGALSQLARLGAQLIIQRAVEEEFDAFLGRERYERRADALPGKGNGYRPRHLQTAEGELEIEVRQVCEAAEDVHLEAFSARVQAPDPDRALERRWSSARSSGGCRCATSSRCAPRLGSATCRPRRHRASARSCESATKRSAIPATERGVELLNQLEVLLLVHRLLLSVRRPQWPSALDQDHQRLRQDRSYAIASAASSRAGPRACYAERRMCVCAACH